MLNKITSFIRQNRMVEKGDHVICALSGGADSVALTFGLYLLKEKLGIRLSAAHFNHRLRGEESDRDEAFVRDFCARYDIPLYTQSGEIVSGKKGLEAAARDARYAFLRSLPGKIATAHTADDNAETVLMHLVRGTGLKGLGGISPVSGSVIRPMLSVTREDVEAFCGEWSLRWVEDSSNETDAFLRNRLRHHVLPLLRQENPRFAENTSAMALRLRMDEQCLTEALPPQPGVAQLRQMHPARRARALEQLLKELGVREPEAEHIALAEALVFSDNPSAAGNFPGGITLCRCYDRLVPGEQEAAPEPVYVPVPGTVELPGWGLRIQCAEADSLENTDSTFTVQTEGPVLVRSRKPGDTVRLAGGSKSLKKLFIDRKIPAARRERIPVLADETGILGIYSIGVNQDRKATQLPAVRIRITETEYSEEQDYGKRYPEGIDY